MDDTDGNAAIVSALQRRADVVVQTSLAEGFGAAVTRLLRDEAQARGMGEAAHTRVRANFLASNHYERESALVARLVG